MPEPETQEYWDNLAAELDGMQKNRNAGRGVEVVRSIIFYLKRGRIDTAKAVCRNECDKFDNIEDIQAVILEKLYKNKNHPWPFSWKPKVP